MRFLWMGEADARTLSTVCVAVAGAFNNPLGPLGSAYYPGVNMAYRVAVFTGPDGTSKYALCGHEHQTLATAVACAWKARENGAGTGLQSRLGPAVGHWGRTSWRWFGDRDDNRFMLLCGKPQSVCPLLSPTRLADLTTRAAR